jgi:glycosyltransferase involved in cell wall biosynthesis
MGGIIYKSRLSTTGDFSALSIVIITLNEENNLRSLLPGIPTGAEIVIVDSGSSDKTSAVAASYDAAFEIRPFDNYATQKNYAMSRATRPWTICLDADERPDADLWAAIGEILSLQPSNTAFSLQRSLVFLGQKMYFGRTRDRVVRLFRSHTAAYHNEIHETLMVDAAVKIRPLAGTLWHYSYENLEDYFVKFNHYTSLVAKARKRTHKSSPSTWLMACRFPAEFTVRYLLKLGFLDGWHGFLWAILGSFYGLIKYAKLRELETQG